MRFKISKESWLPALQSVMGAVDRKQAIPVLGNVLVEAEGSDVLVCATDLEVEIRARAPAEVLEGGRSTLPARKLWEIWRNLPSGGVGEVSVSGGRATLKVGRSRFGLATLPAEGFPGSPELESKVSFRLPMGRLRRLMEGTHFAMAQQDVRYYLNGLLLEVGEGRLRAVGTDGHRLALCEEEVEGLAVGVEPQQAIVPRKGVMEVLRLLADLDETVEVELGAQIVRVSSGSARLTSRLVEARFPEYERVIPDPSVWDKHVVVGREVLRQGLVRAGILANERYRAVRLTLGQGRLGLWAENTEREQAEDEVEAEYEGPRLEIGFNIAYLVDALSAIEDEKVRICFSDENSSCLLQGAGDSGCRYVVMPMRL
jgi:DNA polymerase-3 subunit beta